MPRLSRVRKELVTARMKDTIFEAATLVLGEQGVNGTTMDRVAATAKLAKSSLYDYFASKEDLIEFVFDGVVAPFLQIVEDLVQVDLGAPQKLERLLRTAYDHSTRHRALLRLLVESNQDRRVKSTGRVRILEAITTLFEQGIKEGSLLPHKPACVARMFLGCLTELLELQVSNASDEVTREYVEVLVGAVLHGFTIHAEKKPAADESGLRS